MSVLRPLSALVAVGAAFSASLAAQQQMQVRIVERADAHTLVNEFPVPVVVLASSGAERRPLVLTAPPGETPLKPPASGTYSLEALEPLSLAVSRRELFKSCSVEPDSSASRAAVMTQLADQMRRIDALDSDGARAHLEAVANLAQLELEQRQDEKDTYRNDPLRLKLQQQHDRLSAELPAHLRIQETMQARNEAIDALASDVADLAIAWATVEQAKLKIIHDQLRSLQPIVDNARTALELREAEAKRYADTQAAWSRFGLAVHDGLDRLASSAPPGTFEPRELRKICSGPSGPSDWIEVEAPLERSAGSVLLGEVRFDRGGTVRTYFRRLATSDRWAARIHWPIDATTAAVRLRVPGSKAMAAAGTISSDRGSTSEMLKRTASAVKQIEKNFKDTNFRAVGGDTIKTIPIF